MINVRTIDYEYKIISSFFRNYKNIHIYDEIKSVIMLKKDYKDDKLDTLIHKMHLFLILVCIEKDWDELVLKTFEHVFDIKLDHSNSQAISNIIKSDMKDLEKAHTLIKWCMLEEITEIAFLLFIISNLIIIRHYNDYLVFPYDLFKNMRELKKDSISCLYFEALIRKTEKKHNCNLKEDIIRVYRKNVGLLEKNGIKKVYLFGSISKDEYNDFSDIDLVIESEEKDFRNAQFFLCEFNKKEFFRKSDVYLYERFLNTNDKIDLIEII